MIRRPAWRDHRVVTAAALALLLITAAGCLQRIGHIPPSRAGDIASFIAGMGISSDSPIHGMTLQGEYGTYRKGIEEAWKAYRADSLDRMNAWSGRHIRAGRYDRVFYPFSGPDIITPLLFYPDADEYIMVGLEPPGRLTDPRELGRRSAMAELRAMKYSLHTLMKLNYFRTAEMRKELDPVGFNSIAGIMMFFIRRDGLRVTEVRMVYIDVDGGVKTAPGGGSGAVQGVEIRFEGPDGSGEKKASYFRADLSDTGLRRSPFMKFMARQGRFVTFMKSAGYLPAFDRFSTIRDLILSGSDYIVQDDAGIPIRYLDEKSWRTSFYGTYRTLRQFRKYHQPDLDRKIIERNGGPLDFCYGYGYTPGDSHIITARRR